MARDVFRATDLRSRPRNQCAHLDTRRKPSDVSKRRSRPTSSGSLRMGAVRRKDSRRASTLSGQTSWSPDGKTLVYTEQTTGLRHFDIGLLTLDGEPKNAALPPDTIQSSVGGVLSPDGRFLAYVSNESGTIRGLRATVSRPGRQMADLERRRPPAGLGSERARDFLPERRQDDGGRHRDRAGVSRGKASAPVRGRVLGP